MTSTTTLNENLRSSFDGTEFVRVATPGANWKVPLTSLGGRNKLTSNTNYYVSTSGSDSNPGTSGQPWATLQHAVNFIASSVDIAGFIITINIGAGSFVGVGIPAMVGAGAVYFQGAGSANTTITAGLNDGILNSGDCLTMNFVTDTAIAANAVTWSPTTRAIAVTVPTTFSLTNIGGVFDNVIDFTNASPTSIGIVASGKSFFQLQGTSGSPTLNINGAGVNISNIVFATQQAIVTFGVGVAISNGLTINGESVHLEGQASVGFFSPATAWTGTVTGQRFNLIDNTIVYLHSGQLGPNWIAGSVAGTTDATSSYDGFPGPLPGVSFHVSNYTLALTDIGGIVGMTVAGANTVTIPTNASVPFPIGAKIWVTQTGAGATTIAGAGGVTVNNAGTLSGQWATVKLFQAALDNWVQTNS